MSDIDRDAVDEYQAAWLEAQRQADIDSLQEWFWWWEEQGE